MPWAPTSLPRATTLHGPADPEPGTGHHGRRARPRSTCPPPRCDRPGCRDHRNDGAGGLHNPVSRSAQTNAAADQAPWLRPRADLYSGQAGAGETAQAALDELNANGAGDQSEAIAEAEAAVTAATLAVSQKQADVVTALTQGGVSAAAVVRRTGCRDGCIQCAGDGRGRACTAPAGCCGRSGRSSGSSW